MHANYFRNSDLLYDITPMQIHWKIGCLYSLVDLGRTRLHCIADLIEAPWIHVRNNYGSLWELLGNWKPLGASGSV